MKKECIFCGKVVELEFRYVYAAGKSVTINYITFRNKNGETVGGCCKSPDCIQHWRLREKIERLVS